MLPDSIFQHAWFHANLDEHSAKAHLLETETANFLFCPGSTPDTITLVYAAVFKHGSKREARSIANMRLSVEKFSLINFNCLMIKSTTAVGSSSLYGVIERLNKFLDGWTKAPFIPQALSRADLTAEEMIALEAQYKTEDLDKLQHIRAQHEKLAIIYESIHEQIPPDPEGKGNPYKRLSHGGYTIHSPNQYSVLEIIVEIISPNNAGSSRNGSTLVFLSKSNIRLPWAFDEAPSILDEPDLLDKLLDVCNAKNHGVALAPLTACSSTSPAPSLAADDTPPVKPAISPLTATSFFQPVAALNRVPEPPSSSFTMPDIMD